MLNASRLIRTGRAAARTFRPLSSHASESFLSGSNSIYAEQMLAAWKRDPESVHVSWAIYFQNVEAGVPAEAGAFTPPASIQSNAAPTAAFAGAGAPSDSLGVAHLISAYQSLGHMGSNLDPLGLHTNASFPNRNKHVGSLDITHHGFTEKDLDRELNLKGNSSGGNTGYLEELATGPKVTLRKVVDNLKETYCGTLGIEYMHITDPAKQNWIRDKVENPAWQAYTADQKMHVYERLCFADTFENFLAGKFNTTKRFGLDGGEAVVPALKAAIDRASEMGAHSFIFGMPHRGRLNVLANVMRKPMPLIFKEFQGTHYNVEDHLKVADETDDHWSMSGDVKYHLGTSMDRTYPDGRRVHLSLVANPSHLECVNPLVVGKARAKQFYAGNRAEDVKKVVPILLHGDAAFAGQGIVYETMQMAGVQDFNVGGTIHVVVNNQIGFTTNPINSRSTPYCSDIGKAFNCPIFHVNGDDPLAVTNALETAVEWRHEWGTDVIIDMVCYRRNGHNELDQPHFTQPKLYQEIDKHPSTLDVFEARMIAEGVLTAEKAKEVRDFTTASYEADLEASKTYESKESDWLASKWKDFKSPNQLSRIRTTGVELDTLKHVGATVSTVPESFTLHRQMKKIFKARETTINESKGIDWGTAEGLAFGSLLLEGNHVRITGQDVQRGTFSHRHATVKDQKTEEEYIPLNNLARHLSPSAPMNELSLPDTQAEFTARNSILSEFGVLGFELGYSLENPNSLIMWEAQFGDFMNGAQIMIDQFIAAGEDKWMRQSGLVMLLPHGYDGMGAEHSSSRVERFLQMVDEDPHHVPPMHAEERMQVQRHNWQIVNCTTPANYFHCLRRQVHRDFRKPLIVIAPKNLLRNRACTSTLEEMGPDTIFHRVLNEQDEAVVANAANVRTLVFCTGQIYYELEAARKARGLDDVALVRLEQIAPFAFDRVAENAALYPNAEVLFAQQEPKNMGAYAYCMPRIMTATRELNDAEKRPRYVGRAVSAAPATGMGAVHKAEYDLINSEVFDMNR